MKKAFLISGVFLALTFLFSFSKVLATDGNLNTAGQTVKNVTQGAMNTVGNAVTDAGNAINRGATTVKNTTGNVVNSGTATTANNNTYNATRTSTTQGTFMGMNATAWTWLIVGILGALIVGLVWFYGKEHSPITRNSDE